MDLDETLGLLEVGRDALHANFHGLRDAVLESWTQEANRVVGHAIASVAQKAHRFVGLREARLDCACVIATGALELLDVSLLGEVNP
jgi:hypothetical protein